MYRYIQNINKSNRFDAFIPSAHLIAVVLLALSCDAHDRGDVQAIKGSITRSTSRPAATAADVSWRMDRYVVAQLGAAPGETTRAAFLSAGLRPVTPMPGNALLLERMAEGSSAPAMRAIASAERIELKPYRTADRISRELSSSQLPPMAPEIPILIHLMPGQDISSVRQVLDRYRLPILGQGRAGDFTRVSAVVPKDQLLAVVAELGALPELFFVERVHRVGFFNDRSAGTIQGGQQGAEAAVTPIWQHGIRGQGQIIGIIDTGLDVDACWFSDTTATKLPVTNTWSSAAGYGTKVDASHRKVIAYDFLYSCDQFENDRACESSTDLTDWDTNGHGTHCAGSMVGDSTTAQNNGMAPAAKIVVQDGGFATNACSDLPGIGCPVVDLYPIFEQAYQQGVRVHSDSWGDNEDVPPPQNCNYSARAQDVDRFMWDHKDMLFIFAAGNSGTRNTDFSVATPSAAKNCLSIGSVRTAVGASDNDISSFSSRGWTADGRIKPDLMAPGCNASAGNDSNVATANCSVDQGCGTSYAAPVAAGAAALARQYFTDGFYPSGAKAAADALIPSAALLKAILINGAVKVTGRDNAGGAITPIPSNEQGWGRIQLDRALLFKGATRKLYIDDHATGFASGSKSANTYTITGVDSSEPVKITLVWTDYPGTVDSPPVSPQVDAIASLNKSQLVNDLDLVVENGSDTYYGNVFSGGISAKSGQADRRNTVEQVLLDKPVNGALTIKVTPVTIAKTGQDYALVVTGTWQQAGPLQEPSPDAGVPADAGHYQAGAGGSGATAAGAGGAKGLAGVGGTESVPATVPQAGATISQPVGTGPVAGSTVPANTDVEGAWIGDTGSTECGCRIAQPRAPGVNWLVTLAVGLLMARLRRRRR
jgi:hypothetical protein